jgi:hypothetical protein
MLMTGSNNSSSVTIAIACYNNVFSSSANTDVMSWDVDSVSGTGFRYVKSTGQLSFSKRVGTSTGGVSNAILNVVNYSPKEKLLQLCVESYYNWPVRRTTGITGSIYRIASSQEAISFSSSLYNTTKTATQYDDSRNVNVGFSDPLLPNQIAGSGLFADSFKLRIGGRRLATSNYNQFDGEIYEIMAWNRTLDLSECNAVKRYLERWR